MESVSIECLSKAGEVSRTFALARISGGMTLSGPKACLGSTKDARTLAAFLHSPAGNRQQIDAGFGTKKHTPHGRGQGIVNAERHRDNNTLSSLANDCRMSNK